MSKRFTKYWPGLVLLALSVVLALLVYQDYGKSWDEPIQRQIGMVTYNYVFNGDSTLRNYDAREYGSGFELPLVIIEKCLHLSDSRDIFLERHLATHLFFLLSVFCGYVLAYRLFGSRALASLAFLLLAFHPRIYAHSFFNTKDIPFLSAFLVTMLFCHKAFEKNKSGRGSLLLYVLLGIAGGYTTSIRAMGILLLPSIGILFVMDMIRNVKKEKLTPVINGMAFLAGFLGMLYLAWPLLWSNPFYYFTDSFQRLSKSSWTGEALFFGHTYKGSQLPWNYMPVWFSITVPELWLAAGYAGMAWILVFLVRKPGVVLDNTYERNFLLYVTWIVAPVIAMTALHGVNMDDWRHMYFIYPSFVMLALFTIRKIATGKRKLAIAGVCTAQLAYTGFFMVWNHPFQQVYFNNLVSHRPEYLRQNFDLEYWGCSDQQGLEYILANDHAPVIRICHSSTPVKNAVSFLPARARQRIVLADSADHPDYYITNFRMHPADYDFPAVFYQVQVLNSTILRVYKMHP